jgi:hypothetical protein
VIARMAGRVTGQAAAFLSRSRTNLQRFAEENELAEVAHAPSCAICCVDALSACI